MFRTMVRASLELSLVTAVIALIALPLRASGQTSPHVPTEEELKRQLGETREEPDRTYQADSVESFGLKAAQAASWVRARLSAIHITPARFLVGLGVLGLLFTWNKNKKKVEWAVISGVSLVLVLLGAAAMILRWPQMN
jgi:hypothetical protein